VDDKPTTEGDRQVSLPSPPELPSGKRRVAAVVALSLLEVIRARDLPTEILGSEDPAQTMPRRLGLSEAVELQIRRYRQEARKKRRISDEEARDLFSLVIRRPDSKEVFLRAGEMLAGKDTPVRGWKAFMPQRVRYALARRQAQRRFRALFGRSPGGFAHGRFNMEGRSHVLLELDPGGDACALLTGFIRVILERYVRSPVTVTHPRCQARGDDLCRWTGAETQA